MSLQNVAAERAVIGGVCKYGKDAYLDIADIIQSTSFTLNNNQIIFECLKRVFEENIDAVIDPTTVVSTAKQLGYDDLFSNKNELNHLRALFNVEVAKQNVRKFAAQIRKLEISRLLREQLEQAGAELAELDGTETVNHILGIAEKKIFDFSGMLNADTDGPIQIATHLDAYIENIKENLNALVGISTGFKRWDAAIGGGLRRKAVSLVGARTKAGKSLLAASIGFYVANTLKIPVLYIDTEMGHEDHYGRLLAWLTGIPINSIERGKPFSNKRDTQKIEEATKLLKTIPMDYMPVPGVEFEEILANMRRWLFKKVGQDDKGRVKDCLVIYDWFKLATSGNTSKQPQEFQALGFQLSGLANFVNRFGISCLAFTQLNRDGITNETEAAMSQSDRLAWFCSNFSIFKRKDDAEQEEDDEPDMQFGNRKMIPVLTRHSSKWKDKDYINFNVDDETAKVTEGKLRSEVKTLKKSFEPDEHEQEQEL